MSALHCNETVRAPASSSDARLELAAVCRLVAREGFAPITGARFAVRDPERPGIYFTNPGGLMLEEVSASKLLAVDAEGVHLDSGKAEADSGALALVLAALEASQSAVAAAQIASTAGCVVASLREGLLPITQTAFMFHNTIGIHEWDPTASQSELRENIATEIAGGRAVLVRGRGLLVTGKTLAQLWKLLFFLDKCCRSQITAMAAANAARRSLTIPSKAVIEHAVAQSRDFLEHARFVADWPSFLDQIDSENPSFRD